MLHRTSFWQRRSLPVLVGVSISGLTLFLWQALAAQESTQIQRQGEFALASVEQQITGQIQNRILSLVRMGRRWELEGGTPEAQWYADADNYIKHYPGFQAIEWVDSSFYVRWIVPIAGNEAAQNLNLAFEERRRTALEASRERQAVHITRTVTLVQGGKGFLVYIPLFLGNRGSTVSKATSFDGFILGVFRLKRLLDTLLNNHIAPGYAIAIFDGGEEVYCRDCSDTSRQLQTKWHHQTTVNLDGVSWQIRVWPTSALLAEEQSLLPEVVLGGGLITAVLLAGMVYLAQTARRRTQQLAREMSERQQVEETKKETESILEHQTLRSQVFAELTLKIRRSLQLEEILQITVTEIQRLLQADRVIILRFWSDGTGGTVVQEAVLLGWSSVMDQGITDDCFGSEYLQKYRQGRIFQLPDVENTEVTSCLIDFLHQFHVKSKLVVPILLKEELWGLLIVHQCSHSRHWNSSEVELLQQLADQVGIALAKSQLVEALRESEERFRTMADSAPVLLWISDTNGQCTFFNHSWLEFTGKTLEQEVGNGWTQGVHPEDWQLVQDIYQSAGENRQDFQREYRLRHTDGEYRWVLDQGTPRFLPNGSFAGYIGSVLDISDRREVERLKDEFISVVSHELRTPLTSILGALDLLASGTLYNQPEQSQRMLKIAANNADRLVRLINDILDIERIESGRVTMTKQMCHVEQLINAAVDVITNMAQTAEISLSVSPLSAKLWVDPDRIIQVLTNLLSNAIKFSPHGSTVWLTAQLINSQSSSIPENLQQITEDQQPTVLFQVRDQGRGIPADKIETIFGRFQQVDASDSRKKGGTGLGLAVCRSIVQHHEGQIWAQSSLGQGSTFSFTLPALQEEEFILTPESNAPLVLVCDDDPSIRTVVQAKLEQQGYQAMTVGSGEETVEQAMRQLPDAILLNLMMPGMNGWETLAALKKQVNTQDIPVIILSGLFPDAREVHHSQVSDWIIKPPDEKLLLQALERALTEQNRNIRVLIIEDDTDLAKVLIAAFERYSLEIYYAQTGLEAIQLSQRLLPDLLVLDLVLPEYDGFAVVDWLRQHNRLYQVPLVVYTAQDLDDSQRERLKLGQTLFLTKSRITPEEFEQRVINLLNRIIRHRKRESNRDS
ncbi:MAG: response regulator [Symploca sp. SIO2E6]|nr:response regulator [Symploca sp. SIO2E6]